jgi:hypothetical protein
MDLPEEEPRVAGYFDASGRLDLLRLGVAPATRRAARRAELK